MAESGRYDHLLPVVISSVSSGDSVILTNLKNIELEGTPEGSKMWARRQEQCGQSSRE